MNADSGIRDIPASGRKFIFQAGKSARFNERIEKLVTSRWFTTIDAPVLDVSEEIKEENIGSLGVVDADGHVVGIVVRQTLLNLLSRQYGREVLKTDKISSVMTECKHFGQDTNIFTVVELISHEMKPDENSYYAVTGTNKEFIGIFSSNDMLVYLSTLTRRDIELARIIQKGIVREFQYSRSGNIEIASSSVMAQSVGGDFYSIENSEDGKLFLAVCDVSGKGIAASLVTAFLSGMIRHFRHYHSLSGFIKELNGMFIQTFNMEKYVTGQFIVFDTVTGELTVCDMGHPLAYSFKGGRLEAVFNEARNIPLGISLDVQVTEYNYTLQDGEILMILTDGFTEQSDIEGNEFSIDIFNPVLAQCKGFPLKSVAVRVLEAFHRFRKKNPLRDDATIILVRKKRDSGLPGAVSP